MPLTVSPIGYNQVPWPPTVFVPLMISDGTNTYYWLKTINTGVVDGAAIQALLDANAADIWADASQGPALTQAQIDNPDGAQAYFQSQAIIIAQSTAEIASIGNAATAGTILNALTAPSFNALTNAQKLDLLRADMQETFQQIRKLIRYNMQQITPANYIPQPPQQQVKAGKA